MTALVDPAAAAKPGGSGSSGGSVKNPAAKDFLARHRGGGLFTEVFSQRAGAHLAVAAYRLGLAPTVLTLGNLLFGLAAAVVVTAVAETGRWPELHLPVGLGALVLWHLAYAMDCADGQLARLTGRASACGKRVDVLCDVATQISLVAAVVAVAHVYDSGLPSWLIAAFAGTWMVNLVTSVLQQGDTAYSLVTGGSPVVRTLKLARDYGAVLTVIGLTLAIVPQWTVWLLVAFTLVNGSFLLVSIAATARASLREGGAPS